MEIKAECLPTFKRHLTYVIRDEIAASADRYADVAMDRILRADPALGDEVALPITIFFKGILEQFRKYQEGDIDAI